MLFFIVCMAKVNLSCFLRMWGTDKRQTIIGIFAIKKEDAEPADDLEDDNLGNIANALTILFGLMYSLDLSCPHTPTSTHLKLYKSF